MLEPRCLVCGAPLNLFAPFEKEVRKSEVCSDKCYDIYMTDDNGHIMTGEVESVLDYEDTETGNQVWVHNDIQ